MHRLPGAAPRSRRGASSMTNCASSGTRSPSQRRRSEPSTFSAAVRRSRSNRTQMGRMSAVGNRMLRGWVAADRCKLGFETEGAGAAGCQPCGRLRMMPCKSRLAWSTPNAAAAVHSYVPQCYGKATPAATHLRHRYMQVSMHAICALPTAKPNGWLSFECIAKWRLMSCNRKEWVQVDLVTSTAGAKTSATAGAAGCRSRMVRQAVHQ